MSSQFADAKTNVFWDVEDFALPEGRDLVWFSETLKLALMTAGYRGEVSINAYGPEEEDEDVIRRYTDLGIIYKPEDDKYWRVTKLLLDIVLGTKGLYRPPSLSPTNLLVISRNTHDEGTEFVNLLEDLCGPTFNVLLVLPSDCVPEHERVPKINSAWYWDRLLDADQPIPWSELRQLVIRGFRPPPLPIYPVALANVGTGKPAAIATGTCPACIATSI